MRYWGFHYDVGVHFVPSKLSREDFNHDLIRHELETLAGPLHANAVRIVGEDLDRLAFAARAALELHLAVFLSPWLIDRGKDELLPYLSACAHLAEDLRSSGGDVVLVVGCELSLFASGVIAGNGVYERLHWLLQLPKNTRRSSPRSTVDESLWRLLVSAVEAARLEFGGPISYASGPWEQVPWELFDMVGIDYYRAGETAREYAVGLRAFARPGVPLAVMEFGCCTYEGADAKGGLGWMGLDEWCADGPVWLKDQRPRRSEETQAKYVVDQLDIFTSEGIEAAFVYTFVAPYLPHNIDPERDFDMSSFAVVKTLPGGPDLAPMARWEPKAAFHALAAYFDELQAGKGTARRAAILEPNSGQTPSGLPASQGEA